MYSYPVPFLAFLAHFHIDQDYFECHELLEEHWKKTGGGRHSVWVGFIQSAVFLYHYRRGNKTGALRLAQKALHCFHHNESALIQLGIDPEQFLFSIRQSTQRMENGAPFEPIDIPIVDEQLEKEFSHFVQTFQPELNQSFLKNKHILRDRTDVLEARAEAITLKKAGKVTT